VTLLLLFIAAVLAGLAAAALAARWDRRFRRTEARAAGKAGEALARHRGLTARLDPKAATGLLLLAALAVILVGAVIVTALAFLVRGHGEVVRVDNSVAVWGHEHASSFSLDGLDAISFLGRPTTVVVLAALLAIAETVRTRSRWVIPFVFVVVAGNGTLTTAVKHVADRLRPELNPIAETLGPSFPSGHSSWSAAFFAAAALLLGRGRPRGVRIALTGAAAGMAVLIAGSRVLLSVHWLSDVIAGLALGSAWFCVCAIAFGGRLLRFGEPAETAQRAARGRRAALGGYDA
jgi:membrane-associated phospholipid phosphatase